MALFVASIHLRSLSLHLTRKKKWEYPGVYEVVVTSNTNNKVLFIYLVFFVVICPLWRDWLCDTCLCPDFILYIQFQNEDCSMLFNISLFHLLSLYYFQLNIHCFASTLTANSESNYPEESCFLTYLWAANVTPHHPLSLKLAGEQQD